MADQPSDDADDEITRIVRRPGPAKLPVNIVRPANVAPVPAGLKPPAALPDATVLAPALKSGIADNDAAPPVAPPSSADRPRPVLTPPAPRPPLPVASAAPVPAPAVPTPPARPVAAQAVAAASTPVVEVPAVTPASAGSEPTAADSPLALLPERVDKPTTDVAALVEPVVGWLVVVKGPGRGAARGLVTGRNAIGSAATEAIPINFGDPAIVPHGHAYIVYDDEAREFVVEDGKQKIIVRLNGRLLTETMPIAHGDHLRIGATTLRFVALCGADFDWSDDVKVDAGLASEIAPGSAES